MVMSTTRLTRILVLVLHSLVLVGLHLPGPAEACLCHVIPNFTCPPPPRCCESGYYAKDECGCCLTCAKAELQPCGGPNGAEGKCAPGLQCLKTCGKIANLNFLFFSFWTSAPFFRLSWTAGFFILL